MRAMRGLPFAMTLTLTLSLWGCSGSGSDARIDAGHTAFDGGLTAGDGGIDADPLAPDASPGTPDASPGAPDAAPVNAQVLCGAWGTGASCEVNVPCCAQNSGGLTYECTVPTDPCELGTLVFCDGPEDCPDGQICCSDYDAQRHGSAYCRTGPCPGTNSEFCHGDLDCPGRICCNYDGYIYASCGDSCPWI
jgi:hypothetical protein